MQQELLERLKRLSPEKRALLESRLLGQAAEGQGVRTSLVPRADDARQVLSFAERRMWFLDQLAPGNPFYNLPLAARFVGELDVALLKQSFAWLMARHESLRTVYPECSGQPQREIREQLEFELNEVDLSGLGEAERQRQFEVQLQREARRPFVLSEGPLFRVVLYRLAAQEHVVLLAMHHIVADGWSMAVMLRELGICYAALERGAAIPLEPLPIQYADFAAWQAERMQDDLLKQELAYWKEQLADEPPPLDLPTDRPRPRQQSFEGATLPIELSAEVSHQVRQLARTCGTTPFVVLLAAYNFTLGRYTREDDIAVGTVVANRTQSELESLIGFFANTLVLRTDLSGDPSFRELIERARQVVLGAQANQELPFEKLVEVLVPERRENQAPFFQVGVVYQNAPMEIPASDQLRIELLPIDNGTAKYDLTFFFTDLAVPAKPDEPLTGHVEFQTSLFDVSSVERMISTFTLILEKALESPDTQMAELPLLSSAQRQQILTEWNETNVAQPAPLHLHGLFEQHADLTPSAVAVQDASRSWTYGEIESAANLVAQRLLEAGVEREQLVGICTNRTARFPIAILGVLKAGAAFVPLDPQQPAPRLKFQFEDTQATLAVCPAEYRDRLPEHLSTLDLDAIIAEALASSSEIVRPEVPVGPHELAYVIYTSGSTGRPKGVLIEHRGIVNFMRAQSELLGVTAQDRTLQSFSPVFDGATSEVFLALVNGAALMMPGDDVVGDVDALAAYLCEQHVSIAKQLPSMLQLLPADELPNLRVVLSAGEALTAEIVRRWAPGRRMFNGYGPTEATVGVCIGEQTSRLRGRPPIGGPLANMKVYVLDENRQPVPVGMPGEIYIGGVGVARGYLNEPTMTAEKFLTDPFAREPNARMYRTGDLGRWRDDGQLDFLGRADEQVKIRGFRIEPGEVAAVLAEHARVEEAVVIADMPPGGNRRLVAYAVPREEVADTQQSESQELAHRHVDQWRTLFEETHRRMPAPEDPTFNIAGWLSSYTGRPIAADQMQQWVDTTVERIRKLQPRRVLEVGVGTGLLLYRLAPECESYTGTDFSGESLAELQRQVEATEHLRDKVRLHDQPADTITGLEPGSFDTIVINSVVQYFPSTEYLLQVLDGMSELLAPGGSIFLGDLRSLPLAGPFAAAVEVSKATGETTRSELLPRVHGRLEREEELLLDPALFAALPTRLARLTSWDVWLKRGADSNELTDFRYDAILRFDQTAQSAEAQELSWDEAGKSVATMVERVRQAGQTLVVRHVPNARVQQPLGLWQWLQAGNDDGLPNVAAWQDAFDQQAVDGVNPEELYQAAAEHGLTAEITFSRPPHTGHFDLTLRTSGSRRAPANGHGGTGKTNGHTSVGGHKNGQAAEPGRLTVSDFKRYGNDPLASLVARRLVSEWRGFLVERLPEYMVPAAFVVMERLPRTLQGKIHRRALPAPPTDRPQWSSVYVAPRDEHETMVAEVWEEQLGVQPIGVDDNFFELGGHSMLAVQVMGEIHRRSGRRLPLSALFQNGTVEHLATLLKQPEKSMAESVVVPLSRQGTLPGFFCIHPAGGTVFCYRQLAERLAEGRPFYGIQAVGLDGVGTPQEDAVEMAAYYANAIREIQPQGPYHLGGWSLGGNLAFETARQLQAQGAEVGMVAAHGRRCYCPRPRHGRSRLLAAGDGPVPRSGQPAAGRTPDNDPPGTTRVLHAACGRSSHCHGRGG